MPNFLKIAWSHPLTQTAKEEFREFLESISSSLNESLFDASPDFWSYHLGGIAFALLFYLTLNSILASAYVWDFYIVAGITWSTGFFFSGLILRSHYLRENWETYPHTVVLFKTIFSCIFFSFFIVMAMSVISINLYFDDFYRFQSNQSGTSSSLRVIGEFIFKNWFSTFFYLVCWMMLYIGITSRRKTKRFEIDNLRLQNNLKEAELSSLSNQLNPHFLFNALNAIQGFFMEREMVEGNKYLKKFSQMIRRILENSEKMWVSFRLPFTAYGFTNAVGKRGETWH